MLVNSDMDFSTQMYYKINLYKSKLVIYLELPSTAKWKVLKTFLTILKTRIYDPIKKNMIEFTK